MEINLNGLQRSIQKLEKSLTEVSATGYGVSTISWSVKMNMFQARNSNDRWSDLDNTTNVFEGMFKLVDDISYLKKLFGKTNCDVGLYSILVDIESCNKLEVILKNKQSVGMFTREEVDAAVLTDTTADAEFSMNVTDYSTKRFNTMRESNSVRMSDLLSRRDILNAEVKVDISAISEYSQSILGLKVV